MAAGARVPPSLGCLYFFQKVVDLSVAMKFDGDIRKSRRKFVVSWEINIGRSISLALRKFYNKRYVKERKQHKNPIAGCRIVPGFKPGVRLHADQSGSTPGLSAHLIPGAGPIYPAGENCSANCWSNYYSHPSPGKHGPTVRRSPGED